MARRLEQLEARVEQAVATITRLRQEKAETEARLAQADENRRAALERLQVLLDRIDALL